MSKVIVKNTKLSNYRNIFANGAHLSMSPAETEVYIAFYTERIPMEEENIFENSLDDPEEYTEPKSADEIDVTIEREYDSNISMSVEDFRDFVVEVNELLKLIDEEIEEAK
jgi:hypothetical protein